MVLVWNAPFRGGVCRPASFLHEPYPINQNLGAKAEWQAVASEAHDSLAPIPANHRTTSSVNARHPPIGGQRLVAVTEVHLHRGVRIESVWPSIRQEQLNFHAFDNRCCRHKPAGKVTTIAILLLVH